jgi:hypothetical protein
MINVKTVDDYAARRELFMKSVEGVRLDAYVDTAWNRDNRLGVLQ